MLPEYLRRLIYDMLMPTASWVIDRDYAADLAGMVVMVVVMSCLASLSLIPDNRVLARSYQLVAFSRTTPDALFARKIKEGEYEYAHALAKAYDLDDDAVLAARWERSAVNVKSIQDILSKITEHQWVLQECRWRPVTSLTESRMLLEFGLSLRPNLPRPFTAKHRLVLSHCLARLETLEVLVRSQALTLSQSLIRQFYFVDIYSIACYMAENVLITGLEILFDRYPTLRYFRLEVLAHIPEICPPADFIQMLPNSDCDSEERAPSDLIDLYVERSRTLQEEWEFADVKSPYDILSSDLDVMENVTQDDESSAIKKGMLLSDFFENLEKPTKKFHSTTSWYLTRASQIDADAGRVCMLSRHTL